VAADLGQRAPVPAAGRLDGRLEHDRAGPGPEHGQAVPVAVGVHADDDVDLVCQHPLTSAWGSPVPVWGKEPRGRTVMGHARGRTGF
jgi:hypothetical protein